MTKVFVAGSTGFTGRAVQSLDSSDFGLDLVLHVRPSSPTKTRLALDRRVCEVSLDDPNELAKAMYGASVVVQLIGTVRKRFDENTSYESVDYMTTKKLLEAAQKVGVKHFVLLSSAGASLGVGSYLATKKRTEELVSSLGIPFTILRPGFIAGNAKMTERPSLSMLSSVCAKLSRLPAGQFFNWMRPMDVEILAKLLLNFAAKKPNNRAIAAPELWQIASQLRFL